jgi:hypothetical protein
MISSVAIAALNFALGLAGFGFLSGALNSAYNGIFAPKKLPTISGTDLVNQLEGWIDMHDISTDISKFGNSLDQSITKINDFLNRYGEYKTNSSYVLCPLPVKCTETSPSETPPKCDFVSENNKTIKCMTNQNNSNYPYDPCAVLTPHYLKNQVVSSSEDSKRNNLTNYLKGDNELRNIVENETNGIIAIESMIKYISGVKQSNMGNVSVATAIATNKFYNSYIYIMNYSIVYYQELAMYDPKPININNKDVYHNPWISTSIGTMDQLGGPQSGLLGLLQAFCTGNNVISGFYNYIINTFQAYYYCIAVEDKDNGCCQDSPYKCKCVYFYKHDEYCDAWKDIVDTSTVLNKTYKDTGKTWYNYISEEYNDPYYSQRQRAEWVYPGKCDQKYNPNHDKIPLTYQDFYTKYMVYYNVNLNYPFETYLDYMKMAGLRILSTTTGANITADDLFNNLLYDLFNKKDKDGNTRFPITKSLTKIDTRISYDPSGGYPFGYENNRPSYAEALAAYNNGNADLNPNVEKINSFNTYCTPLVSITPKASSVNAAAFFNIAGDSESPCSFFIQGGPTCPYNGYYQWTLNDGVKTDILKLDSHGIMFMNDIELTSNYSGWGQRDNGVIFLYKNFGIGMDYNILFSGNNIIWGINAWNNENPGLINTPITPDLYTYNYYCEDPKADSIKSCLLPGIIPGFNNQATNNSRKTFCLNSQTKTPSNLCKATPDYKPSVPAPGKFKYWKIMIKNMLILKLDENNIYYYNDTPINDISWNNSTMIFAEDLYYFTFGINESIISGVAGPYGSFPTPVNPENYIDTVTPPEPPFTKKTWSFVVHVEPENWNYNCSITLRSDGLFYWNDYQYPLINVDLVGLHFTFGSGGLKGTINFNPDQTINNGQIYPNSKMGNIANTPIPFTQT